MEIDLPVNRDDPTDIVASSSRLAGSSLALAGAWTGWRLRGEAPDHPLPADAWPWPSL